MKITKAQRVKDPMNRSREWTPADWKSWSDIHGDEIRDLGKESGS